MAIINKGNFGLVVDYNSGDQIFTGSNSLITLGSGSDAVTAGDYSTVLAGNGNDTIAVGSYSTVTIGSGNNVVTLGNYSSVTTGSGNNTVYASGTGDIVNLGWGNDTVVVAYGTQSLSRDFFDGGLGHDTLDLTMTTAQWLQAATQADIKGFVASTTSCFGQFYSFQTVGITTIGFEQLTVFVDGYAVSTTADNSPIITSGPGTGGVTQTAIATPADQQKVDSVGGVITFRDFDLSDRHSVSVTPTAGGYLGTLSASVATDSTGTTSGAVAWTFSVANGAIAFLGAGQTLTQTYVVAVADGRGGVANQTVAVTITGTNDAALIGAPPVADVTEDLAVNGFGYLTAAGTIAISDLDQGQAGFQTSVTSAAGNLGGLVLQANGAYTYSVADSAVQYLGASDTKVDTFTIASIDGTTKTVTFTIHGTNDAAVIGPPTVSGVTEDFAVNGAGNLVATGTISVSDVDQNQSSFQTVVTGAAGNLGNLVLQTNGAYAYTVANSAVQYLGAADTKVDTFTIKSFDGTTKNVSFTIQGANDAAVIGTPTVSSVTEDVAVNGAGSLTASGTISVSDVDQNQSSFQTVVTGAAGNLGNLVLQTNGAYTYSVADSAVQYLGAADTKVDTFTIKSFDGTTKTVSFTIQGANDAAVIGTPTVSSVTEDVAVNGAGSLTASGTISVSDVDQNQSSFQTVVTGAAGNLGNLVLQTNGAYNYSVADSAVQYLGAADTKVDTFTIKALDGTTKTVSFTIQGANDAAVIGTPTVSSVTEDVAVNGAGSLTASGTISVVDADQNQSSFQTVVTGAAGNLGNLVLQTNGAYAYTVANSAVQYLGAADTKVDTFTIKSFDGTTKTVSFTIQGANDAAVIGTPTVSSVTEDVAVNGAGSLTALGTIGVSDVDQNQSSFQTVVTGAAGNLGNLVLQTNGAYTYSVADSAVQYLGAADTKVDTFTIKSLDGTTKTVSFTIQGANDAAVIGTPTVSAVTEDVSVNGSGNLTASGTISVVDADQNQSSFQTAVTGASGNLGTLTLAANGAYTYSVADGAVQYLGAADTKVDTFTIKSLDGTAKTVSFTIQGANDAPVLAADTVASHALSEQTGVTGSTTPDTAMATLVFSDVDLSDTHTVSSSLSSSSWSTGGTVPAATTSALAAALGLVETDSTGTGTGSVKATFSLADNAADFLAAGETLTVTYNVSVSDGTAVSTRPVTFTVTGTNDAPIIAANDKSESGVILELLNTTGSTTLDKTSGTIHFSDVDLTDRPIASVGTQTITAFLGDGVTPISLSSAQISAVKAAFQIVPEAGNTNSGAIDWSYKIADSALDFLPQGATIKIASQVAVSDASGGSDTSTVTVTLAGGNDLPLIAAGDVVETAAIAEQPATTGSATLDQTSGTIHFADADFNDKPSASIGTQTITAFLADGVTPIGLTTMQIAALKAAFQIAPEAGNTNSGVIDWSYKIADSALDFLPLNATIKIVSQVMMNDLYGGGGGAPGTTSTVTVTITGADDAPVGVADTLVNPQAANGAYADNAVATIAAAPLLGNDTDPDIGDVLSVASVSATSADGAKVTLSNGSILYDPTNVAAFQNLQNGQTETDSFTYIAQDAAGLSSAPTTVTLTVAGTNHAPVANADKFTGVAETGTTILNVLANDTDFDHDTLSVTSVTQPADGSVSINNAGQVVFDPGTTFAGLSVGQTATVAFNYTESDGHGGTAGAQATVQVAGQGTFSAGSQTASSTTVLPSNSQNVYLQLTGSQETNDGTGHVTATIGLGTVLQPTINVVYVIDTSGSESATFGSGVGDVNGDGQSNTRLDAEIQGLINLTNSIEAQGFNPATTKLSIVPFDTRVETTGSNKPSPIFNLDAAGVASAIAYLKGLKILSETNYEDSLRGTISAFAAMGATASTSNFVYFVSDGVPDERDSTTGQTPVGATGAVTATRLSGAAGVDWGYADEVATLTNNYNAKISAIGIGSSSLTYLNAVDNTGGAETATSPSQLTASLLGSPVPSASVTSFQLLVNGVAVPGVTAANLVSSPIGLSLNVTLAQLKPYLGDDNTVEADVTFTGGATLKTNLDITGVLPHSYDVQGLSATAPSATLIEAGAGTAGVSTSVATVTRAAGVGAYVTTGWTPVVGSPTAVTENGVYGSAVFDTATGKMTYTLDNTRAATDALAQGDVKTEAFTIGATTAKGQANQTVTFTIDGTDDAPVASAANVNGTENVVLTGALSATDVDTAAANLTYALVGDGAHGTVALAANGAYTYTPDPDYYGADSFTYAVDDGVATGNTAIVNVAIAEVEQPPVLASLGSALVLDGTGYFYPVLSIVNAPFTWEATFTTTSSGEVLLSAGPANAQGFEIGVAANGTLYAAENGVFQIQSAATVNDGQPHKVAVTYDGGANGTDPGTYRLYLDGVLAATGTSTTALDFSQGTAIAERRIAEARSTTALDFSQGTAIIGADQSFANNFTGTIDNVQIWNTVRTPRQIVADGAGVAANAAGLIGDYTFDADSGTTIVNSATGTGALADGTAYGSVTHVALGAPAPIFERANVTGSTAIDSATGTLSLTDPDLGDTHLVTASALTFAWSGGSLTPTQQTKLAAASSLGLTTTDSTGTGTGSVAYTYAAPDDAFDFLAAGETLTVTATITADDQHGGTSTAPVSFTVIGDDAPVASAITGNDYPDGGPITLTAAYTDPDQGDTHTYSIDTTGTQGSVTNNDDGTFAYDPTGKFSGLQVGQTATDSFNYTVTDAAGAFSTATATVTIKGDAPATPNANFVTDQNTVVSHTSLPYTLIDTNESYTLSIGAFDTDGYYAVEQVSVGGQSTSSTLASFSVAIFSSAANVLQDVSLNGDGTFTFDPTGHFDYLAQGQSTDVSFAYQVTDAHGSSTAAVTIEVDGVNDAPTVFGPVSATKSIGSGTASVNLLTNASDVDQNSTLHVSNLTWNEGQGAVLPAGTLPPGFALSADGNSLTVDTSKAYAALVPGAADTNDFTYDVVDEHGASVTQTASISISAPSGPTVGPTIINGTPGQDVIYGNGASDTIDGKGGNDLLIGNAGQDTFVFQPGYGQNQVDNFAVTSGNLGNHDVLDISAFQFADLAAVIAATTTSNGNATIQLSPTDSVTLMGVTGADLQAHPEDFKGSGSGWTQTSNTPGPPT